MSIAAFEREIVRHLKGVKQNPKITSKWLMEWSTSKIEVKEGEELIHLPGLANSTIKRRTLSMLCSAIRPFLHQRLVICWRNCRPRLK